jgi:hypothetical protein
MNSKPPRHVRSLAGLPPACTISPTPAPGVNDDDPTPVPPGPPTPPRLLLDRLRDEIRVRQYSIQIGDADVDWARRFILFHGKRHAAQLGVCAFLTHLAVAHNVAPSTQNQAKSALLFL